MTEPRFVQTSVGPIQVIDRMPAKAMLMCSADYQAHPLGEMYVVPLFNAHHGRFVGSYRCGEHLIAALGEAYAYLHGNLTEESVGNFIEVFLDRGCSIDGLQPFVAGMHMGDAVDALLVALANRDIKLTP